MIVGSNGPKGCQFLEKKVSDRIDLRTEGEVLGSVFKIFLNPLTVDQNGYFNLVEIVPLFEDSQENGFLCKNTVCRVYQKAEKFKWRVETSLRSSEFSIFLTHPTEWGLQVDLYGDGDMVRFSLRSSNSPSAVEHFLWISEGQLYEDNSVTYGKSLGSVGEKRKIVVKESKGLSLVGKAHCENLVVKTSSKCLWVGYEENDSIGYTGEGVAIEWKPQSLGVIFGHWSEGGLNREFVYDIVGN